MVTHTVPVATAKMPLAMMRLVQHLDREGTPGQFRCRAVIPAAGTASFSVWDTTEDAAALLDYVGGVVNGDAAPGDPMHCANAAHEIAEPFVWGLARDLLHLRTKDSIQHAVGSGARHAVGYLRTTAGSAAGYAGGVIGHVDQRLRVKDAAAKVGGAALQGVGTAVTASKRVLENEAVAKGVGAVNDGVRRGWGLLSSAVSGVLGQVAAAAGEVNASASVRGGGGGGGAGPPSYESAVGGAPGPAPVPASGLAAPLGPPRRAALDRAAAAAPPAGPGVAESLLVPAPLAAAPAAEAPPAAGGARGEAEPAGASDAVGDLLGDLELDGGGAAEGGGEGGEPGAGAGAGAGGSADVPGAL